MHELIDSPQARYTRGGVLGGERPERLSEIPIAASRCKERAPAAPA